MMSSSIFVAFAGLVALTAISAQLELEGASTMTKLVNGPEFKNAISPITVTYGGNGSGAGRTWVNNGDNNGQVMAFGDGPFVPLPDKIAEVPIAFGSIALYVNLPGMPVKTCLSLPAQCRLFNAETRIGGITNWKSIIPTGLPANLAATPVRIVVRSDSSGSTGAVRAYYNLICPRYVGSFTFAVNTATSPPTIAPGYVGGDTTSGVVAQVKSVIGSIGYAGCDQPRATDLVELPLANLLGTCSVCRNCLVAPSTTTPLAGYGTNVKCGNYAKFAVATPGTVCDWTGIQVNGDKDNDGDIYGVDTDNDGDGIGKNDFAIVFAEYAYFNRNNRETACGQAKQILKKLISAPFQPTYATYGFYTLPLNVRKTGCLCIKQLCGGVPTTSTGVMTAAGICV